MTLLPDPLEHRGATAGRHLVAVPDPAPTRSWRRWIIGAILLVVVACANTIAFRDRASHRETTSQLRAGRAAAVAHERELSTRRTALEAQIATTEAAMRRSIAARDASKRQLAQLVQREQGTTAQISAVWTALDRQQKELAELDSCLRSAHHALNTVSVWDPSKNLAVLDASRLCEKVAK
jgi:septal ring factor EnvC (AmiA/AmiB activator)